MNSRYDKDEQRKSAIDAAIKLLSEKNNKEMDRKTWESLKSVEARVLNEMLKQESDSIAIKLALCEKSSLSNFTKRKDRMKKLHLFLVIGGVSFLWHPKMRIVLIQQRSEVVFQQNTVLLDLFKQDLRHFKDQLLSKLSKYLFDCMFLPQYYTTLTSYEFVTKAVSALFSEDLSCMLKSKNLNHFIEKSTNKSYCRSFWFKDYQIEFLTHSDLDTFVHYSNYIVGFSINLLDSFISLFDKNIDATNRDLFIMLKAIHTTFFLEYASKLGSPKLLETCKCGCYCRTSSAHSYLSPMQSVNLVSQLSYQLQLNTDVNTHVLALDIKSPSELYYCVCILEFLDKNGTPLQNKFKLIGGKGYGSILAFGLATGMSFTTLKEVAKRLMENKELKHVMQNLFYLQNLKISALTTKVCVYGLVKDKSKLFTSYSEDGGDATLNCDFETEELIETAIYSSISSKNCNFSISKQTMHQAATYFPTSAIAFWSLCSTNNNNSTTFVVPLLTNPPSSEIQVKVDLFKDKFQFK